MSHPQASGSAEVPSEHANRGERRKLKIRAFGNGTLSFLDVPLADTKQAMNMMKSANNRKYAIYVLGDGMITIEYDPDDVFKVALFNHSRWVTNLCVDGDAVKIGNVARAQAAQVNTMHVTRSDGRNTHAVFKLQNNDDALLKRVDVKGHSTSWFSVFSHDSALLMARPNGDWLAEKLQYLTDQMTTKAINNYRRSNGQEVLPSADTVVMRRRQNKTVAAQTTETSSKENRAIQLLLDERVYGRRFEQLHEAKERYEAERKKVELMEARLARLAEEEEYYKAKRPEVIEKLVQVGKAGRTLAERMNRLQREREQFEEEQEAFTNAKKMVERVDQGVQTAPSPWSMCSSTAMTLSERFTRYKMIGSRVVMGEEGTSDIKVQFTVDDLLIKSDSQAENGQSP